MRRSGKKRAALRPPVHSFANAGRSQISLRSFLARAAVRRRPHGGRPRRSRRRSRPCESRRRRRRPRSCCGRSDRMRLGSRSDGGWSA